MTLRSLSRETVPITGPQFELLRRGVNNSCVALRKLCCMFFGSNVNGLGAGEHRTQWLAEEPFPRNHVRMFWRPILERSLPAVYAGSQEGTEL